MRPLGMSWAMSERGMEEVVEVGVLGGVTRRDSRSSWLNLPPVRSFERSALRRSWTFVSSVSREVRS